MSGARKLHDAVKVVNVDAYVVIVCNYLLLAWYNIYQSDSKHFPMNFFPNCFYFLHAGKLWKAKEDSKIRAQMFIIYLVFQKYPKILK